MNDLWGALDNGSKRLPARTNNCRRTSVPIEIFSPFFYEELDVTRDRVMKTNCKNDSQRFEFDCFLAHDWGTSESGLSNT